MAASAGVLTPPPPTPSVPRDPRSDASADAATPAPAVLEMRDMLDTACFLVASVRHRTR